MKISPGINPINIKNKANEKNIGASRISAFSRRNLGSNIVFVIFH